jgi:flagellar biosynthetic protein FliR
VLGSSLTELFDLVVPASLVFTRIVGFILTVPVLSVGMNPTVLKASLAILLTVLVLPVIGWEIGTPAPTITTGGYVMGLIGEFALGLMLGWFVDLYFQAVRFGGDLIGRTAGYAAAEIFNPDAGGTEGPVGAMFATAIALLFLLGDGHLHVLTALTRSFELAPPGDWRPHPGLAEAARHATNDVFEIGLVLAMPVISAVLAVTVAEGVISRAVPQINILHLTFATKIVVFLIVTYTGLPAAVAFLAVVLETMYALMQDLLPVLQAHGP